MGKKEKKRVNNSWPIEDFMNQEGLKDLDLADACEDFTKLFGANKNLYRIIPSMNDGLKPVQRRFLYSTWTSGNIDKFKKMGILASNTMAIHPHGDKSIADVGGNMAQSWNNNACYIQPQGNFGSIRGDELGSGRYIEGKLSKYALKCFFEDFKYANVDMKLSYGGDIMEPEFLPARYPNALFNPQLSGIGYAFASNIPPFNIEEVLRATIALLKNPKEKILLVPDSPTKCNVVDDGQFEKINETGVGTFTLESTYTIDHNENIITITSVPLQVSSSMIIDRIIELMDKKKIEDIKDIQDHTAKDTVYLEIFLKPDADPEKVLKTLFKKNTGLRMTYPVGLKMIDDYKDYDYGVRSFLLAWIEFRREIVRSMYNTKLVKKMEAYHMNEVLILISNGNNSVKTINIIRHSKNSAEAAKKLMKEYGITSLQAETISNMKLIDLTIEKNEFYLKQKKDLEKEIAEIENVLDVPGNIDNEIIKQLEEGIELFGVPRKSKIIKAKKDKDSIPNTNHLIGISKDGYIKKLSFPDSLSIGVVGKISKQQTMVFRCSNRSNLLVFSSTGVVSKIAVSSIPDMAFEDNGISINRYFKVDGTVIGAVEDDVIPSDTDVILVTKNGYGKKTSWKEFEKISDNKVAIIIDPDDELVSVITSKGNTKKDLIIYTNMGNGVRLNIGEMKTFKRNAKGSRQLALKPGEVVVGVDKMEPKKKYLAYITSTGRLKLTETKYFPQMNRKDETISLISLDSNEILVGIVSVTMDDILVIYRKNGDPVEVPVNELNLSMRIAKPEKKVKTPKGESVIAFTVKSVK